MGGVVSTLPRGPHEVAGVQPRFVDVDDPFIGVNHLEHVKRELLSHEEAALVVGVFRCLLGFLKFKI